MTICIDCLDKYKARYNELRSAQYSIKGKGGVVAITARDRVEDVIISALRLALMKKEIIKGSSNSNMSATAAAADSIHINPEEDNDDNNNNIFYDAVANAFDHSQRVREYFYDDRSRTQSDNKRLWPLRYQAYKEFGI